MIRAPYLVTATNRSYKSPSGNGEKFANYPDREFFSKEEAQDLFNTLVKDGDFKTVKFFDKGQLLAASEEA